MPEQLEKVESRRRILLWTAVITILILSLIVILEFNFIEYLLNMFSVAYFNLAFRIAFGIAVASIVSYLVIRERSQSSLNRKLLSKLDRTMMAFEREVRKLTFLNEAGRLMIDIQNLPRALNSTLESVARFLGADYGKVILRDEAGGEVITASASNLGIEQKVADSNNANPNIAERIALRIAANAQPLLLPSPEKQSETDQTITQEIGAPKSAVGVPLKSKDRILGVLTLWNTKTDRSFSAEDLKMLTILSDQLEMTIENALLFDQKDQIYQSTIQVCAAIIEANDPHSWGHSAQVTKYSMAIADKLNLSKKERKTLELGALLHDIGRFAVDKELLTKAGKLENEETKTIQTHPDVGAKILQGIKFPWDIVPLVRHHHEWYNGSGYPKGIQGKQIPLGARIIAVADSFDSMTSTRAFREAYTWEEAVEKLRQAAGTQFDPKIVQAFLEIIEEKSFEKAYSYQNLP